MCPRLESIILQSNYLVKLSELDNLPKQLKRLVCLDNVVANLPNYKQYVILRLPNLKMLDYQKVTKQARKEAKLIFSNNENLDKIHLQDKIQEKTKLEP